MCILFECYVHCLENFPFLFWGKSILVPCGFSEIPLYLKKNFPTLVLYTNKIVPYHGASSGIGIFAI